MRAPVLSAVIAFGLVAIAFAGGCQTYDFEPVQPLAIAQTTQTYRTIGMKLKPNMALLLDKSGSMSQTVCSGCPSRMDELKSAMSNFLTTSGKVARMSLTLFPASTDQCAPASSSSIAFPTTDADADLQATANNINNIITATNPGGGTPTAASLTFVGQQPELSDGERQNFILLLTDGLPNCNPDNPNDYSVDPAACRCTSSAAACGQAGFTKKLCLDRDAAVAEIAALKDQKRIRTIVVGFGADTTVGDGPEVLQAMAVAGGFPRECPGGTNAECGTGTCDVTNKTCAPAFYQAANAADLATVLSKIADGINPAPCDYTLAVEPSDLKMMAVLVNGTAVPRGADTWQYLPPGDPACPTACQFGEVQLTGQLCTDAKSATDKNPVNVEIRLLRTF